MKKNFEMAFKSNSTSANAESFSCEQNKEATEFYVNNIIIKSTMIIVLFLLLCLNILPINYF